MFIFLTKIQSYTPLPFNAFVPKLIHLYLKAISQNQIKSKTFLLIKMHNSLLSRMPVILYQKYVSFQVMVVTHHYCFVF